MTKFGITRLSLGISLIIAYAMNIVFLLYETLNHVHLNYPWSQGALRSYLAFEALWFALFVVVYVKALARKRSK